MRVRETAKQRERGGEGGRVLNDVFPTLCVCVCAFLLGVYSCICVAETFFGALIFQLA